MKCKNGCADAEQMELAGVWDDPNEGIAFNIHICNYCGSICKADVWKNAGELWIDLNNNSEHFSKITNNSLFV